MADESMRASVPQFYRAHHHAGMLGRGWWTVRMNNYLDVQRCESQAEAEFEAAIRNYREGCYGVYGLLGQ